MTAVPTHRAPLRLICRTVLPLRIVGTVRGAPLGDVDAFSFVQTHDGSTFLSVRVVSFPHACTDVVSMVQRNTFHQTSYGIDLNISNQSGEVAPGTYPVNVTYPSEMPIGDVRVNAAFVHNDPQCVQQSIFASSGTIQLDEVTASRIGGSFDLFIGEPPLGRLRGSFAAPSCDAFATVTTFPDAGAGACLP